MIGLASKAPSPWDLEAVLHPSISMRNLPLSVAGHTSPCKTEPGSNRGAMFLWAWSTFGSVRPTISLTLTVTPRLDSWLEAEWTLSFPPALIGEFRAMLSARLSDPTRVDLTIPSGLEWSSTFSDHA